jgi:hypothetical protein
MKPDGAPSASRNALISRGTAKAPSTASFGHRHPLDCLLFYAGGAGLLKGSPGRIDHVRGPRTSASSRMSGG